MFAIRKRTKVAAMETGAPTWLVALAAGLHPPASTISALCGMANGSFLKQFHPHTRSKATPAMGGKSYTCLLRNCILNKSRTLTYFFPGSSCSVLFPIFFSFFFFLYDDERLMHCEWNLIEMSQDQLGQGLPCKTTHVLISCTGVHTCNPIHRIPSIIYELTLSNFNTAHACPARVGLCVEH